MTAPFAPQFPLDDVRVGLVQDAAGSPWQPCTVTVDSRLGIQGQIPYVNGDDQFLQVAEWFRKRELPKTLLFSDRRGQMLFHGVRWAGTHGAGFEVGTFRAEEVILGDPREFRAEYLYRELRSRIDGLDEFVRARPIALRDPDEDEDGVTHLRIDQPPLTEWEHDGFTYALSALTPWQLDGGEAFTAATHATVTTTRDAGATGAEHLSAQWPVRALLLLLHGTALAWRSHEIRDEQYPFMMMSGEEKGLAWTPIRLRRTNRDIYLPPVTEPDVALPLLHLQQIGADGMKRWLQLYSDDAFARAIDPVVEVLNGASSFYEIRVMMTALGLDAMGYFHDSKRRRGQPIAEQIRRCVTFSGLDWSDLGDLDGIGPFLARVNNDLKHPDRDKRPDGLELYLADALATTFFRSQLAPLLELDTDTQQGFATRKTFNDCVAAFQQNGVLLEEKGCLQPRA